MTPEKMLVVGLAFAVLMLGMLLAYLGEKREAKRRMKEEEDSVVEPEQPGTRMPGDGERK